jgi:hypothetical protein
MVKLFVKGRLSANEGGISGGGNKFTEIPAAKLFLDINPLSDHHGHGFWTGKYSNQDEQVEREENGRSAVMVNRYYNEEPEVEDETVKAMLPSTRMYKRGARSDRVSTSDSSMEPKELRRLHGKPPKTAKVMYTTVGHGSSRRHPVVHIVIKKNQLRFKRGKVSAGRVHIKR